jgi:uncharacterized protein YbbK (DUF523 family)
MNILISGCLLGIHCRYDGTGMLEKGLIQNMQQHHFIPICPEQLGGLQTPRDPAECVGNKVITKKGEDVTNQYMAGAEEALKVASLYNCKVAILKERSPSCGCGKIYDGTFSNHLVEGDGITSQLLKKNGIKVIGESQLEDLF